jgi:diacylglycerol kinase family enzyme
MASFALITKVRNYGGDFEIARRVRLTDHEFEVIVFENNVWHDYVRFLGAVILNRLYKTAGVTAYRATEASIAAPDHEPIYVQTDGESIGSVPARIVSIPNALTLLIPKRYTEK